MISEKFHKSNKSYVCVDDYYYYFKVHIYILSKSDIQYDICLYNNKYLQLLLVQRFVKET